MLQYVAVHKMMNICLIYYISTLDALQSLIPYYKKSLAATRASIHATFVAVDTFYTTKRDGDSEK